MKIKKPVNEGAYIIITYLKNKYNVYYNANVNMYNRNKHIIPSRS